MFDPENEEVLNRMRARGVDLSSPRVVDFTVVFGSGDAAKQFANLIEDGSCCVKVEKTDTAEGLPWDVAISKTMIPTNERITTYEMFLGETAEPLGGRNDGWGILSE